MIRTARKLVPAVAVIAVLGTGWASAATLNNGNNGKHGNTRSVASRTTMFAGQPPSFASSDAVDTQVPALPAPASPVPLATVAFPRPAAATPPSARVAGEGDAPHASAHENDRPASCGAGEGTYRPATEGEFRTVMTGVWLLCQTPSFFGTSEAGMELRADGGWSKLERRPNGALARVEGWENEGSWDTVDTSAMNGRPTYQINFQVAGGGGGMTVPDFGQGSNSSLVTKVRLNNMGLFVADYVPAPPDTKISPVPFPPAPGIGCDAREELYTPTSEAEFRSAMTRAWLLCGSPSFFGTYEDGLEIRPDGRWSKLYRTSSGSLVRGAGPSDEGTWETFDTSAMNGRPTYQINFNSDEGGSAGAIPAFASRNSEVSKVRLNNFGVFVADYIPAPKRPVTGP